MNNEELKNRILRFKKLEDFIKSFQEEKDLIEEQVLNHFEDNNIKDVELEDFTVVVRKSARYKYSEKVDEKEKEILSLTENIKKEIKELKDKEKKDGTAEKVEGKPSLKIK